MNYRKLVKLNVMVTLAAWTGSVSAESMGTAFKYQGRLQQNGNPANGTYDFTFSLWDQASSGTQIGDTLVFNGAGSNPSSIAVNNGLFNVELDFGPNVINGQRRWLAIMVEGTALFPRQELTPAPHALALPAMRTEATASAPNVIGGDSSNSVAAGVTAATISGGTQNLVMSGATEATIAGGARNTASGVESAIGGGEDNDATGFRATIGGGDDNLASGERTTIGGGENNQATGQSGTVGGGYGNFALADFTTIAGGGSSTLHNMGTGNYVRDHYGTIGGGGNNRAGSNDGNPASDPYPTVAGGEGNLALGAYSVVPGGAFNQAAGDYSFAAGEQALVSSGHDHTFVWSGANGMTSTGAGQFLIDAPGGVGINTNNPAWALHIQDTQGVIRVDSTNNTSGGSTLELRNNTSGTDSAVGAINFVDSSGAYPGQIMYYDDEFVDHMSFRVGGSERMRIRGEGSVELRNQNGAVTTRMKGHGAFSGGELEVNDAAGTTFCRATAGHYEMVLNDFTAERKIKLAAPGSGGVIEVNGAGTAPTIVLNGSTGYTTTKVLEITGGSDLSEKFDIVGTDAVQPGMVVSIDADQPGQLQVARQAYDRSVAGIVSGAGGVNTGMVMGQTGSIADGAHPVALTGRVWTWCDATTAAIRPGDLLTTSASPGHAMKVGDHDLAQGAIIGKAMSGLEAGQTGLVLVLVSLQ